MSPKDIQERQHACVHVRTHLVGAPGLARPSQGGGRQLERNIVHHPPVTLEVSLRALR